ncbi:MAG: glutathione S-transferase family protein, partial [Alphaproteobacteria bacterium]|nr:glutathione S-transferase family protein [Alphaproteobacteria bacterium]
MNPWNGAEPWASSRGIPRYARDNGVSERHASVPADEGEIRPMALPVLHHAWRSSASRRVRLCLAEKGVAFESVLVDLAKGEQHTPQYLAKNPLGVIPLLVLEDGRSLYESGTICEYLDETIPDPPLRPDSAYDRATLRNWIRHVDGLIGNLIIFNWKHSIAKVAARLSDAELAEKLRSIPSKERQEAWLRAARKP